MPPKKLKTFEVEKNKNWLTDKDKAVTPAIKTERISDLEALYYLYSNDYKVTIDNNPGRRKLSEFIMCYTCRKIKSEAKGEINLAIMKDLKALGDPKIANNIYFRVVEVNGKKYAYSTRVNPSDKKVIIEVDRLYSRVPVDLITENENIKIREKNCGILKSAIEIATYKYDCEQYFANKDKTANG